MRKLPDRMDKWDKKELAQLKAEDWMLELLKLNPDYVLWGPHEDHMGDRDSGWGSPLLYSSWEDFGPFQLNEFNECCNFYFEVDRPYEACTTCRGSGYNYDTAELNRSWDTLNWGCDLTQDEVDALLEADRLCKFMYLTGVSDPRSVTAEMVNTWARQDPFEHDEVNRRICVETRAKRLGFWGSCEKCDGEGVTYPTDKAQVNLILWMLHPRKGASRGVEVQNIQRKELPEIKRYLVKAARRNQVRFAKVV